jgi:O-antigen/teichoic acid export membrane protein
MKLISFAEIKKTIKKIRSNNGQINWAIADQAVVSFGNFITTLILARALGLNLFGIFTLTWLLVLFLQSLQLAFILKPMLSIGPKQSETEKAGYYNALTTLQLGFGAVSAIVAAIVTKIAENYIGMSGEASALTQPTAAVVIATQIHEFYRRYLFSSFRPWIALRMDAVRYSLQICILLYISTSRVGNVSDALWVVAGCSLSGIIAMLAGKLIPTLSLENISKTFYRHWRMSRWLVMTALMQWTSSNFLVLITGTLLGPTALGAIRAAQNLMGVTHVIFETMNNWVPVRAAIVYQHEGLRGLVFFIKRIRIITVGLTVFIAIALAIPGLSWLKILYGIEYEPYEWILICYGVTYILMAASLPYTYAFTTIEKTRPIFIGYLAATTSTIMLTYPLLINFGLYGSLAGIFLNNIVLLITAMWHAKILFVDGI